MRRAWVITAVVLLVAVLVGVGGYVMVKLKRPKAAAGAEAAFEPFESVQIVKAQETTWQPTADLVGTVIAKRSVMVRNELPGPVTFVGFQSGDVVEPGQVLLKQDETTEQADLRAVQAAVRVAEANIEQVDSQIKLAQVELDRLVSVQSRAVAEVDLDRARTKLESAQADRGKWIAEVDQARARVAQVEARLAKLTLKAPFRARAGMRTVDEGQYLAEGIDVIMLQELTDTIYLDFAVPQEYAPLVKAGTSVMATGALLGPDPVRIEVMAADAVVNNDTRNLRIRAIVENKDGTLVPGMFVAVRVPIGAPRTLVTVPNMTVRRAAYANYVFTIAPDKDGTMRAHQRFVTVGENMGEDVIVLEGLKAGEEVGAAGSFKLRDGVKIMVNAPSTPPAGASSRTDAESGATGETSKAAAGK